MKNVCFYLYFRELQEFQEENRKAVANISDYLANPINAFLLIRRLTTSWNHMEYNIKDMSGSSENRQILQLLYSGQKSTNQVIEVVYSLSLSMFPDEQDFLKSNDLRKIVQFPSEEDLQGAAQAITRIQDTYDLETGNMSRGILNGIQYRYRTHTHTDTPKSIVFPPTPVIPPPNSTQMTISDCFEVGRQAYNDGDYYHTILWMQETLSRLDVEPNESVVFFTRKTVLSYLLYSTKEMGKALLTQWDA